MRIVFFGTPEYVVPIVDSLHKAFKSKKGESPIVAVVTQNPKPVGRKQFLEYSPVDTWAHKKKIPIYFSMQELIDGGIKADVGILAAYGKLLPDAAVNYFPFGILVIHPSLLPQFRWGSPVQAAIVCGTNPTGVTIIKMDEKFDHGPIISQFKEDVLPDDTTETLRKRLFEQSAQVTTVLLPAYLSGKIRPRNQDHSKATFARLITKEDAFIPPEYIRESSKGRSFKGGWKIPFIINYEVEPTPYVLERFIRAMQPWPVAWTYVQLNPKSQVQNPKRLKILKSHVKEQINKLNNKPISSLILDEVQLEGKNPVPWKQFAESYTAEF